MNISFPEALKSYLNLQTQIQNKTIFQKLLSALLFRDIALNKLGLFKVLDRFPKDDEASVIVLPFDRKGDQDIRIIKAYRAHEICMPDYRRQSVFIYEPVGIVFPRSPLFL